LVFGNFKKAFDSGNIQNIFNALNALVRLPDPRVQEAFDFLKSKNKGQTGLLVFIKQFETQFKKSLSGKK